MLLAVCNQHHLIRFFLKFIYRTHTKTDIFNQNNKIGMDNGPFQRHVSTKNNADLGTAFLLISPLDFFNQL